MTHEDLNTQAIARALRDRIGRSRVMNELVLYFERRKWDTASSITVNEYSPEAEWSCELEPLVSEDGRIVIGLFWGDGVITTPEYEALVREAGYSEIHSDPAVFEEYANEVIVDAYHATHAA